MLAAINRTRLGHWPTHQPNWRCHGRRFATGQPGRLSPHEL